MTSIARIHAPLAQRALLLGTFAVPITGWTLHAVHLHRRLTAARKDPLTGLPGRDTFTTRAHQITTWYGDSALIVVVDLDHFKTINDQRGHAAGDRVLAETARRLTAWAGSRGVAGRLGGDEFAVALRSGPARRERRLAHLVRELAQPVEVDDGALVDVAASVGAASPDVLATRDLSQLLRAADAAMYEAKHTGEAILAGPQHATWPSVNGRRAGRPGTHVLGNAA
jgi:diguanylate cyclase (GGDEF)-like protein